MNFGRFHWTLAARTPAGRFPAVGFDRLRAKGKSEREKDRDCDELGAHWQRSAWGVLRGRREFGPIGVSSPVAEGVARRKSKNPATSPLAVIERIIAGLRGSVSITANDKTMVESKGVPWPFLTRVALTLLELLDNFLEDK